MAETVNKLAVFERLGLEFTKLPSGQAIADCPFCGKSEHFFCNIDTGQWDCKVCLKRGNAVSYMTLIAEQTARETHESDYRRLSDNRGIPTSGLREALLGWSGSEWWIPCYGPKGHVRDIRRWITDAEGKGRLYNTSGELQLWGIYGLAICPAGADVWLCEGEWDGIALRWLLDQAGRPDVVVAAPGAGVFKRDWPNWFAGKNVRICYDADEAGDLGSEKAGELLKPVAKTVLYLNWPDARPTGWDIRDFVKEGRGKKITAEQGVKILEDLCRPTHRRHKAKAGEAPTGGPGTSGLKPATFWEVLKAFSAWVKMDKDFHDALAICLAVGLSNDITGDPLWFYIVGPPGSGKSLILMSLQDSERCFFRSTLTPASLVSGFNVNPDPSLLPQMNGRTAVFKDGTELLAMHPEARKEAYGVLRGAFDGSVSKSFGNGVKREYHLHFNMLVGITPAIHGDNQATMGERFLKFEMRETGEEVEAKIRAAISNIGDEVEMQKDLNEVCARFLARRLNVKDLPRVPEWVIDRTIALSQLLAVLRAQVDRENYGERDIRYRPSHEIGTRIGKQLIKLGQVLTQVFDKDQIDEEVYEVMFRVALDTSIGFHLDIVRMMIDRSNEGFARDEISRLVRIPGTTIMRRLQDLEQLQVLRSANVPPPGPIRTGPIPKRWFLTQRIVSLWERATGTPMMTRESFRRQIVDFEGRMS